MEFTNIQARLNNLSRSATTMSVFPKFKCSFPNCSFTAKRMALLKNHIRNHSEEKPFKCRYCSYSTQSRSNCKVHEQRMHTFQRPHKCQYCAYCCVQSSTLRQHVQIKHKDHCQYRCVKCLNFHCQREGQLTFHLLKFHQISSVTNITHFLNPNYISGGVFAAGGVPGPSMYKHGHVENMPYATGMLQQSQSVQNQPSQNTMNASPVQSITHYKPMKSKQNDYSPSSISTAALIMQRPSQSLLLPGTVNSPATTSSIWTTSANVKRTSFRQGKKATRQASLNDLSEHSLLASASLIAPLDDPTEVIEIENDDEVVSLTEEGKQEGLHLQQDDSHIFVCNHCLLTFTSEESFMNHMLANHPDTAILDHADTVEASLQLQEEGTRQDNITSSSNVSYAFTTNQSSMMDTSPVPVAISQNDFAAHLSVKQEGPLTSPTQQETWLPLSNRDHRVASDGLSQRFGSDSTTESVFPNNEQNQDHGRPASHDGSIGQSAREGTPLFDMPSPTTTHSNIATTSTQTIPLSLSRGGSASNLSKYCCVHCKITFPDNVLFTIHRGAHGFHSAFECNFCGKDCGNKYEFASHLHNCS